MKGVNSKAGLIYAVTRDRGWWDEDDPDPVEWLQGVTLYLSLAARAAQSGERREEARHLSTAFARVLSMGGRYGLRYEDDEAPTIPTPCESDNPAVKYAGAVCRVCELIDSIYRTRLAAVHSSGYQDILNAISFIADARGFDLNKEIGCIGL